MLYECETKAIATKKGWITYSDLAEGEDVASYWHYHITGEQTISLKSVIIPEEYAL